MKEQGMEVHRFCCFCSESAYCGNEQNQECSRIAYKGVMILFEMWKDCLALAYEALEKVEERSSQQAEMRQQKIDEVKEQLKQKTTKARERMREEIRRLQSERDSRLRDIVNETGLATKEELAEVREMLVDLNKKIDTLAPKKPSQKDS